MSATNGSGSSVEANQALAQSWETFQIINLDGFNDFRTGDHVALRTAYYGNKYVDAFYGCGQITSGAVIALNSNAWAWETFMIVVH